MIISAIGNVDAAADRLSCHGLGGCLRRNTVAVAIVVLQVPVPSEMSIQIFSVKKRGRKKAT